LVLCAGLVVDAVLDHPQQAQALVSRVVPLASEAAEPASATAETEEAAQPAQKLQPVISQAVYPTLSTPNGKLKTVTLGGFDLSAIERTDDPEKYKFMVVLTSKGAAVQMATLSEFKVKSDTVAEGEGLSADADPVDQPLTLLSPWTNGATEVYTLANKQLWLAPVQADGFGPSAFPLNKLNWQLIEQTETTARFEASLSDDSGEYGVTVIKTYRVTPGSYDLICDLDVENLSTTPVKVMMKMQGPGGMEREAVRQDSRKVKVAYFDGDSGIEATALDLANMKKKLKKASQKGGKAIADAEEAFMLNSKKANAVQAWSALTNKYFAAIIRSLPTERADSPWLQFGNALYNPSLTEAADDHSCSFVMASEPILLGAAGSADAAKTYSLAMYLGPKDKQVFEDNETYKGLQFFQTIDFRGCCCPTSVIAPMAFGIMWLMNTLYTLMGPLGNYGVVIIFLVLLVRLAMHPITKKSQVSMMKMQKLGPMMKEIQAKYANNKQEMNKQVMAMYRDQGVSPVSGMLPMFLQMPIWIALWTAVYTSIDMRGAGFLPFWITDLSLPDRLFRLPIELPFFGEYFNLLPLMMGGVMYLQQKMMPSSQPAAQADSQMAQQQKMMMIMMPLMFPVMLYNGPAGVNLYIMSSIGAGVIEQKVIRKHIKEKEEQEAVGKVPVTAKTGGKVKKKKPKPFIKG
jgi:YidC/Oxa1 family membrane protein insertase